MASEQKRDVVTLHLKTDRAVRDQLLGALRARGVTMQHFFDTLMRTLVDRPTYIEQIKQWDTDPQDASTAPTVQVLAEVGA